MKKSERRGVNRIGRGNAALRDDDVVVEAPLELRVGGRSVLVTMRTPGNDLELIRGFLWAEQAITVDELSLVRVAEQLSAAEQGNVVDFTIDPERFAERWTQRALFASSACGVCGATAIDSVATRLSPLRGGDAVSATVIGGLVDSLRAAQPVFDVTGAIHAAGLFDSGGGLLCVREDVGRHNAVDKVIGWAAGSGLLPAAELVLVVSGRISFEIAYKAAAAGIPIVVSVSAPTTLAIDVAERCRVCLCGFTREGKFNIYSHPFRVS